MKKVALSLTLLVGLAGASEQLAKQKGCMACHDLKAKKVGPTYADIAKKYADRKDAANYLAERIKKGGSGVWGPVPMPPQKVSDLEAKQLADWIMSLNEDKGKKPSKSK